MSVTAVDLVRDIKQLVSLPEVSLRISQMAEQGDCTAVELGRVISQDASLSARLLRIANSPVYGLSSRVDTVSRAVTLLGLQQIRDLVIGTTATRAFDGIPTDLVSLQDFWHHSLYCGLLAQELGEASSASRSESLFLAGLLHDIGQLVMFYKLPQHMHSALLRTLQVEDPLPMYRAEREVIGFDHAQVGEALAELWRLPSNLRECIAFHHEPGRAKLFPVQVALVHVANAIASLPFIEESELDDWSGIEESAWQQVGLTRDKVMQCCQRAAAHLQEVETLYFER
ncbi:MAG: HDOD domain-containing protein [Thiohalophilus sp.]|uniref:HDOD domain-containing protein n=1 Tax=Thiohalophilus sp. TaxID=3028392 RepID=UPI002870B081|nr:HDOD domain-containing protein [Thiohalophilus sp.]MDR9435998.1 HDOD domain-containing protein [Thiohalophilus sp.]